MVLGRSDAAWIVAAMILLVPVALHMAGHGTPAAPGDQSPAYEGESALDSLLGTCGGRPLVLNFWATWCTPCIAELPEIDAALSSSGAGVSVLAIDVGDPDPSAFREYASSSGLSFPLVWVDADAAGRLGERFDLPGLLPVTIVMDGENREIGRFSGGRDEDFFSELFEGLADDSAPVTDSLASVPGEFPSLHVNVAGSPGDPAFEALFVEAESLAGEGNVSLFDPSLPEDSLAMERLHLPFMGHPYAQACVGDACGRPAPDPETLRLIVEGLTPGLR